MIFFGTRWRFGVYVSDFLFYTFTPTKTLTMKRFLLSCLLACAFVQAQVQKGQFVLPETGNYAFYVAFSPDSGNDIIRSADVTALLQQYQVSLEKAIPMSEENFSRLESDAKRISGRTSSVKNLRTIYKVNGAFSDRSEALQLATKFEALPIVRYCSFESADPVAPPADIPPVTPDFRPLQTYFAANPGVNMDFAHGMGLIGTGIRIRDVEYGNNRQHEEFEDNEGIQLGPDMTISDDATPAYVDHGTAVTGIMCADNGAYGISGLSYDATEFLMFPEWQQSGYNRNLAITRSIENSQAGDVILFEMQTGGQTTQGYVPQEYNAISWDLTKAATDAGIIIVAAAGNGNQNLDATFYSAYMSRGDSGAIIVGGGTPDINHNKIWYSTYGSRVDVQGWADNVYATGYGTAANIGGDYNQQYTIFSGTSSATPVVAGCVVALQQYHFEQTGEYMTPQAIRTLLKETGIAQGTGGHIGPLPDMEAAITLLQEQLGVETKTEVVFSVYPNPSKGSINIHGNFSDAASVEIYNLPGQSVFNGKLSENKRISTEGMSAGMYILKVREGNRESVKKILIGK